MGVKFTPILYFKILKDLQDDKYKFQINKPCYNGTKIIR